LSTNIKIARASFILMAANIIYLVAGIAREVIVASRFGISQQMDAFFAAFTIPDVLNNIVLGAFSAVFIPIYIQYRVRDKKEADVISSSIINIIMLVLAVLNLAILAASPLIVKIFFGGFSPDTAALCVKILKILSFTVFFSGLSGILLSLLNAHEYFFLPAISNVFRPLLTIVFVLLLSYHFGVSVLGLGLLAGILFQIAFLIPALKSAGFKHSRLIDLKHPAVRETFSSASIFLIAMGVSHLNIIIDRIMASYLHAGSISALNYADRIVQVPTIILSGSIAAAVLPFFSLQAAGEKYAELRDSLAKSITMVALIFFPLTILVLVFSRQFIELMYERGAFGAQATGLTATILAFYSLELFSYTVVLVMTKVFQALKKIKTIVVIAAIGFVLKIVLNFALIKLITPPVAGIALSSSLVYFASMLLCFVFLKRILGYLGGKYMLIGASRIFAASLAMGAALLLFSDVAARSMPGSSFELKALRLFCPAAAGAVVFFAAAILLRVDELNKLKYFLFEKPRQQP